MKKRLISLMLILVMTISLMPTVAFAANGAAFAGGSGTASDPYLISTKTHLNNVRNYLNAHFKMTADIEFTNSDFESGGDFYNDGNGFEPIGKNDSSAFSGVFDGDGFEIKNLHVSVMTDNQTDWYIGLFGFNSGTVKNLGIVGGTFIVDHGSYPYTGTVAAYNTGVITNCYSTSSVIVCNGSYSFTGGIVGTNQNGEIKNCYNTGDISVERFDMMTEVCVGGIVGWNDQGTISGCYNTGNVSAISLNSGYNEAVVGGIAGKNTANIQDCYNTGDLLIEINNSFTAGEESYAGGITGINYRYGSYNGTVSNCYNIGSVSATHITGSVDGGTYELATKNAVTGYGGGLTNCYYIDTMDSSDGALKCTAEQLKSQSTFVGFDFENVWTMAGNECYPYPELNNVELVSSHIYDFQCDTKCNCGYQRTAPFDHVYDDVCDKDCNVCSLERIAPHDYLDKHNAMYHWKLCSSCRQIADRYEHSYFNKYDAVCDCGYIRSVDLPTIDTVSITLNNSIAYNVKISADISNNNPYVLFTCADKTYKVDKFQKENGYTTFTLENIAPHYMTENIKAVLYVDIGKSVVAASEYETTIEDYCKSIKDSKYAPIVNAVLNYGAQAQMYTGYKTDILANRSLSDSEKTIAKTDYFNAIDKEYLTIENDKATWEKHGIILDDKVVIKLSFETDEDIKDLSVMVETEWMEPVANLRGCFNKEGNKYTFYFDDFSISELDTIFLFTIYKDGKPISDTLSYSVESYASKIESSQDEQLKSLMSALMAYGLEAKNY